MNTCELANFTDEMNPCELVHFICGDKPVSKHELHWSHNYNSKTSFISERDYHTIMDQYYEDLLTISIVRQYSDNAAVCMTVTR